MPTPRQIVETSALWPYPAAPLGLLAARSALLLAGALIPASGQDAASNPPLLPACSDAALARPLSPESWPVWREAYVRIFLMTNRMRKRRSRSTNRSGTSSAATASVSGGSLPKEFADDPMAWVAMAWTYMYLAGDGLSHAAQERYYTQAEEASRKGIALGDPQAIASYTLAVTHIFRRMSRDPNKPLTREVERKLSEAEDRLRHVEQVSPRANVNLWRGRIAELRGDTKTAAGLLGRAVEDHPKSARTAAAYPGEHDARGRGSGQAGRSNRALRAPVPQGRRRSWPCTPRLSTGMSDSSRPRTRSNAPARLTRKVTRHAGRRRGEGHRGRPPAHAGSGQRPESDESETVRSRSRRVSPGTRAEPGEPPRGAVAFTSARRAGSSRRRWRPPQLVNSTASEIRTLSRAVPQRSRDPGGPGRRAERGRPQHRGRRSHWSARRKLGGRPEKLFDPASLLAIRQRRGERPVRLASGRTRQSPPSPARCSGSGSCSRWVRSWRSAFLASPGRCP